MRLSPLVMFITGVLLLTSCTDTRTADAEKYYFDISGFFHSEAQRLQKAGPGINKTVIQDGSSESHRMPIERWEHELALFSNSDINKPAWKNSYEIKEQGGVLEYSAREEDMRTRKIRIEKDKSGRIRQIDIRNEVKNMLYTSREHLVYIPGTAYRIEKENNVRLMGKQHYLILGKFK